jgi:hypothetical protein
LPEDIALRKILRIWPRIILCLIAVFSGNTLAAEEDAGWDWRLTPLYYWAVNVDGNTTSGDGNPPIDTGDFDFKWEGAFTANFEGVYDNRWGFQTDIIWVSLSNTGNFTTLDFEYLQVELDGFYRIPIGRQSIDLLAGMRYYRPEVSLEPGSIADGASWVDPVIGGRWHWPFAKHWSLTARGDIGGFGIGSDFAWQTALLADWRPWEHVSFTGGFRAIGADFSTGQGADLFEYDITLWGPLLGISLRW